MGLLTQMISWRVRIVVESGGRKRGEEKKGGMEGKEGNERRKERREELKGRKGGAFQLKVRNKSRFNAIQQASSEADEK